MDDLPKYVGPRMQLQLGKFPITGIIKGPTGYDFAIQLPGAKIVLQNVPHHADLREGELLTLYTEVAMVPHA